MTQHPPSLNLIADGKDFTLLAADNGESYILR